jgi:hypothetical protein
MTHSLPAKYDTELGLQIAEVKCRDESIELRLTVAETIFCRFHRPMGQRCVATPKNEKSSRLDSDRLQKQRSLITDHPIESMDDCRYDARADMSLRVALPAIPKLATPEILSNLVSRAQLHTNYRHDTGHNRTPKCTYNYIPEPSEAVKCIYGGSVRFRR